jgi:hypothetical protein
MKKLFLIFLLVRCCAPVWAADSEFLLPGTTLWAFPPDIVAEQYAEMRGFYERQIADAPLTRAAVIPAFQNAIVRNN